MAGAMFSDSAAYERFMGAWTRAAGAVFLDWLEPAKGQRWLELGCGTGVFTELVLASHAPAEVIAIDPAPTQIEQARKKPIAHRADFRVGDAQSLGFADGAFDIAASALVINFIPDRPRAVAEMKRVVKPGGWVAGYVWDFMGASVAKPLRDAVREISPDPPNVPGAESSRLEAMQRLFADVGFDALEARPIEVSVSYAHADDYWDGNLGNPSPLSAYITGLPEATRSKLKDAVRQSLPAAADGSVTITARANAVKGRVR